MRMTIYQLMIVNVAWYTYAGSANFLTPAVMIVSAMLASIESVSICIPRNVRHVVGPSTLDGLIGALILLQNASIL